MQNLKLQQVLGRNLRRVRNERGWTQDDFAKIARQVGLGWTQAIVAAVESGRREALEEILLLQGALNISLSDLLATDAPTVDVAGVPVPGKDLRRLAHGQPVFRAGSAEGMMAAIGTMSTAWFRGRRATARAYGLPTDDLTIGDLTLAESGDAEGKAARTLSRRLGVEVAAFEVAAASFALWGRGMSEERKRRLKAREGAAGPQSAGHVTRELLAELESRIRQRRRQRRRG